MIVNTSSDSEEDEHPSLLPGSTLSLPRGDTLRQETASSKAKFKKWSAFSEDAISLGETVTDGPTGIEDEMKVPLGSRTSSEASLHWRSSKPAHAEEMLEAFSEEATMENRRLYLMIARCIAFPFNAKFQIEITPPKPKLTESSYKAICENLQHCLNQDISVMHELLLNPNERNCFKNENFVQLIKWYIRCVLKREDVKLLCCRGGFSTRELENIFRVTITRFFRDESGGKHALGTDFVRRVETNSVCQLWLSTFLKIVESSEQMTAGRERKRKSNVSENSFNKEQMYSLFQEVLAIPRHEHKMLHHYCQLPSREEQEFSVRKELKKRKEMVASKIPLPPFGHESKALLIRFYDEQTHNIGQLTENLDRVTMSSAFYSGVKLNMKKKGAVAAETNLPSLVNISRSQLTFNQKVKVTVHEVTELYNMADKTLFIVFELQDVGAGTALATQRVPVDTSGMARFDESGEFLTPSPLPLVQFTLRTETHGVFQSDKIVAKFVQQVMPTSSETTDIVDIKDGKDKPIAKLKISTFLERPAIIRKCGNVFCSGNFKFKHWRLRFLTLTQITQFKSVLCYYRPKDTQPHEFIDLEGYTVDYADVEQNEKGPFRFVLANEDKKTHITLGCGSSNERELWVNWFARATGQVTKPSEESMESSLGGGSGGSSIMDKNELDKYGLLNAVETDPVTVDHQKLFGKLLKVLLERRIAEPVFSRGFFSPSQMYILDEYCARYCVRLSHRHLTCLREWLLCEQRGESIWPVMLLHSFGFCQMHVLGLKPAEKGEVVTPTERDSWLQLSLIIEGVLSEKLEHFLTCFPFSCPKDDLRITIKLFLLVTEINYFNGSLHPAPMDSDEDPIHQLITCMERAALLNYKIIHNRLHIREREREREMEMEKMKDEGMVGSSPEAESSSLVEGYDIYHECQLTIDQVFELAELCVEFMYELHDFYLDDFIAAGEAFSAHVQAFWSFFLVDLRECLQNSDDTVAKLRVFHFLNQYFTFQPAMQLQEFHKALLAEFEPLVMSYLDYLDKKMSVDLRNNFLQETWMPVMECCGSMKGCLEALKSVKQFAQQLQWPDPAYRRVLDQKVQAMCANRFMEAVEFTKEKCEELAVNLSMTFTSLLPRPIVTMVNCMFYLRHNALAFSGLLPRPTDDTPMETMDEMMSEDTVAIQLQRSLQNSLEDVLTLVINCLCMPVQAVLEHLAKYDPTGRFKDIIRKILPGNVPIHPYLQFMDLNLQHFSGTLVTAAFGSFVVNWYECQMRLLARWLKSRPEYSLHQIQQDTIEHMLDEIRKYFEEVDVEKEHLNSQNYLYVKERLRKERAKEELETLRS